MINGDVTWRFVAYEYGQRVQFTLNSSTCMVRFVVYPHQYPPLTSAESISTLACTPMYLKEHILHLNAEQMCEDIMKEALTLNMQKKRKKKNT